MPKKKSQLTPAQALGQVICELREGIELSRAEMAERMGVHKNTIYKYEAGECLTCANQCAIADVLGLTWAELIAEAEAHKNLLTLSP